LLLVQAVKYRARVSARPALVRRLLLSNQYLKELEAINNLKYINF
jgi:hypothetical protein